MSTLNFTNKTPPKTPTYSAQDIEVLEGLEPVRRRPGMYIGGTDARALHHLAIEVLDNAMDEAVAGYAKRIVVTLHSPHRLSIEDDGRGIPVDPHPKFPDKSALEVILTTLHSGGKFSQKAYETAGGLHGVGVSVVNALSEKLEVHVYRDQKIWHQVYQQGAPLKPVEIIGNTRKKGTCVTFEPDPTIFEHPFFEADRLRQMVRSKAYLHKGVHIIWRDGEKEEIFHFPAGLLDYLAHDIKDIESYPSFHEEIKDEKGRIECAVVWPVQDRSVLSEENVASFCNTIHTPQGGTHETGFRQALTKALKDYGERINHKPSTQITSEDVVSSCRAVLSVFIREPHFQGQTKEKLVNSDVSRWVEGALKDRFDHWLVDHPSQALGLLDYISEFAKERLQRKQSKEVARQSAVKRLRLPGKLTDCTSTNPSICELFLVEGDSAGGSAKMGRARQNQAVLPLRGKILNVATASLDKMRQNQEISDLILAIGCGANDALSLDNLRYHKIIIMTDADVDGAHIASLLLTFFYLEMRPLIERGHLYLAQPPLYRLAGQGQVAYALNDADKDRLIKQRFKGRVDVTRFKGLGEMPMQQLRETTMDPAKRTLLQVTLSHAELETRSFVERLMGKQAEARYRFIQENARFDCRIDV